MQQIIYSDITLYPYYVNKAEYSVKYDANHGTGAVTDPKKYASGAWADIQSGESMNAPDGKTAFLYWAYNADGTGSTYYPGDRIQITGNLKLYAVYGDPSETTSLTYNSNYPSDYRVAEQLKKQSVNGSETLQNNVSFQALSPTGEGGAGFSVPDGYYFDGWNTSAGGNGKDVAAGQSILVDVAGEGDTPNILFAKWGRKQAVVLKVDGNTETLPYDGMTHKVEGYTTAITVDGKEVTALPINLQLNETQAKGKTASGKDADTYWMGLAAEDFTISGSDLEKYSITIQVTDGSLVIQKRTVTLTSLGATKAYDGIALTEPKVDITGDGFVDGEVSDVRATGSIIEEGTIDNPIEYTKNAAFKEKNYQITEVLGKLTIAKADVTLVITAPSQTFTYDGTAHTTGSAGITVRWSPAKAGEKYTVAATVEGSVKDVSEGDVANRITSYQILNADGTDVTKNFDSEKITLVSGTIRIKPRSVTLTSESASKEFDTRPLTRPDVKITEDGFADGEVTDIKAIGTITKAGYVPNTITYQKGAKFKEENYKITLNTGILTVTKANAQLEITAPDGSWEYDGTAHSTGNHVTVRWISEGYESEYKVEAVVEGSVKNVAEGDVENVVASYVIKKTASGEDVTDQFNEDQILTVPGILKVTPRSVELRSESRTKPYDGTPLTEPQVTVVSEKSFVGGEVSEIRATGSALTTDDGIVPNTITWTAGKTFDERNYTIRKQTGTLQIMQNQTAITVTAASGSKVYDGTALTKGESSTVGLPEGFTAEVKVGGTATNVADSKPGNNRVQSVRILKDGQDVTSQFARITKVDGTLTIEKRQVSLTSDSGSKEYDGTSLVKPEVTVKGTIVETGGQPQIYNLRAVGSVTDVTTDPVPNTIAYDTAEDFIPENYVITTEEGTLSITKNNSAKITFTADSAHKTYDGTPLTAPGVKVTGLPDGFTAEGMADGRITNVMETMAGNNPVASVRITDKTGKDVTEWFTGIAKEAGTLTIIQRKITLTSASAEKKFDRKPLEKKEATISGDGLAENHTISYLFTGSQTYVGTSKNTFTCKILEKERSTIQTMHGGSAGEETGRLATLQLSDQAMTEDGRLREPFTLESNYSISLEFGDLTVTDDTDAGNVVTKTHDGKSYRLGEQIVFSIKVTNIYDSVQTIVLTEQNDVTFTGKQTFEGVKPGETVTTSAYHVVTEADIAAGSYSNTVKVAFKEAGKPWEGTDEEDQFAHLTLKKIVTSEPGNGLAYVKGETIRYRITAVNDGTVTLTDLNIEDKLTEDKWQVETLDPKEEASFETSYIVTDEDVEKDFVENEAVGNAKRPGANENDVIPTPPTVQVPVEASDSSLYVEKTSDVSEGILVAAGDVIHYTIKVLNNGNTVLSDVEVTDELTGDSWRIEGDLKPGEVRTFETRYTVTEKDMLAGSVKNIAAADGRDPGGDKPDVTPGKTEDKTIEGISHLTVTKKAISLPKDARGYTLGEEIHYQIEVVNDGNVAIAAVEVTDALTGDLWKLDLLTPGESRSFEAVYVVKEADIAAGKVTNVAVADGKDPGGNNPGVTPGEAVDITIPGDPNEGQVKGITKPEETENPDTEAPKQNSDGGAVKAEVKKSSGTQQTVTSASRSAAKTGDSAQPELYLILLLIAAGGIGLIAWRRRYDKDGSV